MSHESVHGHSPSPASTPRLHPIPPTPVTTDSSPSHNAYPPSAPPSPPTKRTRTSFSVPTQSFPVDHHRWEFAPPLHPAHFYTTAYPSDRHMPHRVHSPDRTSSHHSEDHYNRPHSHPTPPPIATLHHSPAMSTSSLASSSISPSPPLPQQAAPYYSHAPQNGSMAPALQYTYSPTTTMGARYGSDGMGPPTPHHTAPYGLPNHGVPGTVSTRSIRPTMVTSQSYPGQANYIVHTDDAGTKLSDRVRRKCYNCRTTDTSTWRRSSLTPGKVLCNKCGLFERTHSRPRPEQFPHKRGPLVTATFKSTRTPPPAAPSPSMSSSSSASRLPPISSSPHMHALPPHHYSHPSIAPLMPRGDMHAHQQNSAPAGASSNPEIRSLLNGPDQPHAQGAGAGAGADAVQGQNQSPRTASSGQSSVSSSPRTERREVPVYRTGE